MMMTRVAYFLVTLAWLVNSSVLNAQPAQTQAQPEVPTYGALLVDMRLRYEFGKREDLERSDAFTWRARLGYESPAWRGLSALVEGQANVVPDEEKFDAYPGPQGGSTKTLIADGRDLRLNRASVCYHAKLFDVTAGRQRIIFDNSRFIGDVGWRQNAQMFDAALATVRPTKTVEVTYAYIMRAVRIFGSDADVPEQRRYDMHTHVIHGTWRPDPALAVTGYTYIEDITSSAPDSATTYGGFVVGSQRAGGALLSGRAEYARQMENSGSLETVHFGLNYVALEGKAAIGSITPVVGFESLGGDGLRGFSTPLATLHAFNGWADVFLITPADGLQDVYAGGVLALPHAVTATATVHRFTAVRTDRSYGREFDVYVTKPINRLLTAGAKYAAYRGADDAPISARPDLDRFTVDLNFLWGHTMAR